MDELDPIEIPAWRWQDPTTPTQVKRLTTQVKRLTTQADVLDRKADNMVAMSGRSHLFKFSAVWHLRERAKKLRAEAVRLIIVESAG